MHGGTYSVPRAACFGWLKKTYTLGTSATSAKEEGRTHGHNIIAFDQGYVVQTGETYGPGGTFPVSQLGCQSCHDPLGKARRLSTGGYGATGEPTIASGSYDNSPDPQAGLAVGVYRILYGTASPDKPANATFTSYPVAVAPSTYNRTEAVTQTRVAYGGGGLTNSWGEWCGTCHGDFKGPSKTLHHPADLVARRQTGTLPCPDYIGVAGASSHAHCLIGKGNRKIRVDASH